MPQFDQFSFFTQVSWFLILFFSFYFLFTYYFLPNICYNIKFRKKKIINNKNKNNQINFEKINIIFFINNLNKNFFYMFNLFLNKKIIICKFNKNFNYNKFIINNYLKKKTQIILNNNFFFLKKIFI